MRDTVRTAGYRADEFTPPSPLAGTYKIGGDSPDYPTIKSAFEDLKIRGVSGPTTFEIRDGIYNELVGTVNEIHGASAEDSIVFRSESGNPGYVVMHYSTGSGSSRYMFNLVHVDHLSIMDISIAATGESYGEAVYISGNCRNINIINNILSLANITDNAIMVATGATTDDLVIRDNSFSKGRRGILYVGDENNYSTNTCIAGNNFSGAQFRAIEISNQFAPRILNNTISNIEYSGFIPVAMTNCDENLEVAGNTIINTMGDCGIKFESCVATNPFSGLLANNMISVGDIDTAYGIRLNNSKRMNIYHNSVNITSSDTIDGIALYLQDNNEEISIVNNIFANNGNGYAMYVTEPGDVSLSDYNGLYSTGTLFTFWGDTNYQDLVTLTAASGMDKHSLFAEPGFASETDLHSEQLSFMKAATPLAEVTHDIDGIARDPVSPDIGAMEFVYCETPDFNIMISGACPGDSTTFIDKSSNITDGALYIWDFDGDFSEEYRSTIPNETLAFYYDTAGSYSMNLTVKQVEGCEDYITVHFEVYPPPAISTSAVGAYCGNNNGQAIVNVLEGNGPYSYHWSTGSTDSIIKNLALGTYSVVVTDSNGCTSTDVVTIKEAIELDFIGIEGSTCGYSNGKAEVTVSGGAEPYRYVWSDGDTLAINHDMTPGLHNVNVIDSNGCYVSGSVIIGNNGSGPEIIRESITNNACFGDKAGAIDISISGGTPPYDILWSNGARVEDIDNLRAGFYNVHIIDGDSCTATESFVIQEPTGISIGSVVENASCRENDGKAAVMVSGGMKPYRYFWSSGGTRPIEENLTAGIYSIKVMDLNDCEISQAIIVNNVDGPVPELISMSGVSCADSLSGSIDVKPVGGIPLYSWLWSPGGDTVPKISNLPMGAYEVKVTDSEGCIGFNVFEIMEGPPAVNRICLVTVDSISRKNMIVWEKLVTKNVLHYNIYRESTSRGDYQLIASVPVDEPSQYVDFVADPSIRSWRYRLSVVDVCGNESDLSDHHKTMHLTMNMGVDSVVNLIWDHYEGFETDQYKIKRYDAISGLINLENVPSDLTSRSDPNPPFEDLTYYIEIEYTTGCTVTDKKGSTHNSSRSNRITQIKLKSSGIEDLVGNIGLRIYPNPGQGIFNLNMDLEGMDEVFLRVYDISGKLLLVRVYENIPSRFETQLDLTGFSSGLYHLHVKTSTSLMHGILIKQ